MTRRWPASSNASVRYRFEPQRQRRVEAAWLVVLAVLAGVALGLSDLPAGGAAPIWAVALLLSSQALRGPYPEGWGRRADGAMDLEWSGATSSLEVRGARRFGPWWLIEADDAQGSRHRLRVWVSLLPPEQQRQLGRALARIRPQALPSV